MDECTLWSRMMHQLRLTCAESDGLWIKRRRRFSTEKIVKTLMHLAAERSSYFHALNQMDELGAGAPPSPSSFCEARAKMPSFIVGDVRRDVLEVWDEHVPSQLWYGYRPHVVDGTKVALARSFLKYGFVTPSLGHCPQGLISLLIRLEDRVVCDIRLSSHENERVHALEHLAHLSSGDLVIYDRGYLSFTLLTEHVRLGVGAIFRAAKEGTFRAIDDFAKSPKLDAIATIDPHKVTYQKTQKDLPASNLKPIRLRLIKYEIGEETYILATTLLDPGIPREAFIRLYAKRWDVEETFKSFKETLEIVDFHSKTLNGIEQEVEAHALFWNLTRALGQMAAPLIKKSQRLPIFIALPNQLSTESSLRRARAKSPLEGKIQGIAKANSASSGLLCKD